MEISIVIPSYNEERHIAHTLASVIEMTAGKYKEIIVVDNASSDKTAEIARSFPGVKVIHEPHKGTGHARQSGFEHATGEIVVFVDADVLIPDGWIEKIINRFDTDTKIVLLSGAYRYYESERYPLWLLNMIWWITPPVYWVVGYMANAGNCAIRASALKSIGGWDRGLAFYGDDTDLARRLHSVGKTVWSLRFYNYSSGRRYDEFGIVKTCFNYMISYWWPVLFHRPYNNDHQFVKTQKGE